jgi:arylsulfatase A-like enzyme/Tfp pilus assembly protein PilF
VSIDTLRSDRLPAYGYSLIETPHLDGFRRDAILFERAYSHYPLTLPSHASILTGLLPSEHQVRDNLGYLLDTEDLPYLPRELKAAGYATGAAVSAFVLQGAYGLATGFDFYEDSIETKKETPLGGLQRPGTETLALALDWLDGVADGPFFLFFHIYEPHTPWDPPEPFASRFASPYDGEVAHADSIMGQLFAALESRGLYDPSIILLLSDHGEGLGDHGELEHGIFLYREALQVPLLLKLPRAQRGGETVAAPVQLIDVMPTILELLDLSVPEGLDGRSLLDADSEPSTRPLYAETFYPRLHMGWSELHSLILGGYHFIEAPTPELYHLPSDPAERDNRAVDEPKISADLQARLEPLRTALEGPATVDPDTVARLAALGYAAAPVVTEDGPLPDPKTKIAVLDDLKAASEQMGKGRWADAIPLLEAMLQDNPRLQDGWEKLGLCLRKVGRRAEATRIYTTALENSGGAAHVALVLASLYSEMGLFEEALSHAELALPVAPDLAHRQLAEIALEKEDLDRAALEAEAAVAVRPADPAVQLLLAQVLSRRGELERARGVVARSEELAKGQRQPPSPGFFFVRGDLRARLGEFEAAENDFRREIGRDPEILGSFTRLAVLQVAQGRIEEGIRTLQELVEKNDGSPAAYAAAVETLRVMGDPTSAAGLLRQALHRYPDDPQLRALAG